MKVNIGRLGPLKDLLIRSGYIVPRLQDTSALQLFKYFSNVYEKSQVYQKKYEGKYAFGGSTVTQI